MNGDRPPGETGPRRAGWVQRLLGGWLGPAVEERIGGEIDGLRRELAGHAARVEDACAARLAGHSAALGEVRTHLEVRLDQIEAEVADTRGAVIATRGELERVRDEAVPRIGEDASAATRGLAALESRIGELVRSLQHEVESLRDQRMTRAEGDLGRLQHGLEAVQTDLAGVRDVRLARAEATLDEAAAATRALQDELAGVRDARLITVESDMARQQGALERLQAELAEVREDRVARSERDLARTSDALAALQGDLEQLRDERVARVERDLERLQQAQEALQSLAVELRDARVPALAGRVDALIGRLHEEVTETAGMLERVLAREPLAVGVAAEVEAAIPEAVRAASARFAEAMRGPQREILGRARECLPHLVGHAPVLDLGCGRGELLEVLRDEGIPGRGVDADRAMVAACRRRGLEVAEEDALAALRGVAPGSLGAVTAIHVVEHLPAPVWMALIEAAAAALRPGGVLLVESPNPETLRVGGGLFWIDPTHRAPVHPLAVGLVATAVGLDVEETTLLRPFPPDQALAAADQPEPVRRLAERLDEWLSGPRDFLIVARKRGSNG